MSACPKIINFGTQKSPKINEKLALEIWHQKKQLKNRSWTLMDRTWTPKVVQKGGPGAVPEPTFSALEALLGPNGTKSPPRAPH